MMATSAPWRDDNTSSMNKQNGNDHFHNDDNSHYNDNNKNDAHLSSSFAISTSSHSSIHTFRRNLESTLGMTIKTTCYIGNISESLTDEYLTLLLNSIGFLRKWKRVQDGNGSMKTFGFAEWCDADSLQSCLRFFTGLPLFGKPLIVKIDQQTMDFLHKYQNKIREKREEGEQVGRIKEDELGKAHHLIDKFGEKRMISTIKHIQQTLYHIEKITEEELSYDFQNQIEFYTKSSHPPLNPHSPSTFTFTGNFPSISTFNSHEQRERMEMRGNEIEDLKYSNYSSNFNSHSHANLQSHPYSSNSHFNFNSNSHLHNQQSREKRNYSEWESPTFRERLRKWEGREAFNLKQKSQENDKLADGGKREFQSQFKYLESFDDGEWILFCLDHLLIKENSNSTQNEKNIENQNEISSNFPFNSNSNCIPVPVPIQIPISISSPPLLFYQDRKKWKERRVREKQRESEYYQKELSREKMLIQQEEAYLKEDKIEEVARLESIKLIEMEKKRIDPLASLSPLISNSSCLVDSNLNINSSSNGNLNGKGNLNINSNSNEIVNIKGIVENGNGNNEIASMNKERKKMGISRHSQKNHSNDSSDFSSPERSRRQRLVNLFIDPKSKGGRRSLFITSLDLKYGDLKAAGYTEAQIESKLKQIKKEKIEKLISMIPTDRSSIYKWDLESVPASTEDWIRKKFVELKIPSMNSSYSIKLDSEILVRMVCKRKRGPEELERLLIEDWKVPSKEAEIWIMKLWRFMIYESEAVIYGIN